MNSRKQSIVILLLVAALVSLFWLYVGEQAEDFSSDTLTVERVIDGDSIIIRLTLERVTGEGDELRVVTTTVTARVTCRN